MAKHHKRLIVVLAVTAAVGVVAVASTTSTGRTTGEHSDATDNVRLIDDRKLPEQWVINAAYGRGALSNLRAAVREIENHNTEEARKGIAVAQSLLAKIKPVFLHDTVKPPSAPPTAALDDGARSETDLILVHSEVRILADIDPADSVQSKLEKFRREIDMNDHDAIITALGSLKVPLAYTRIDLPLSETINLVNDSLKALESQDVDQARSKLVQIGGALHIETVRVGVGDSPLESIDEEDAS